jgi:hypothetical protein
MAFLDLVRLHHSLGNRRSLPTAASGCWPIAAAGESVVGQALSTHFAGNYANIEKQRCGWTEIFIRRALIFQLYENEKYDAAVKKSLEEKSQINKRTFLLSSCQLFSQPVVRWAARQRSKYETQRVTYHLCNEKIGMKYWMELYDFFPPQTLKLSKAAVIVPGNLSMILSHLVLLELLQKDC